MDRQNYQDSHEQAASEDLEVRAARAHEVVFVSFEALRNAAWVEGSEVVQEVDRELEPAAAPTAQPEMPPEAESPRVKTKVVDLVAYGDEKSARIAAAQAAAEAAWQSNNQERGRANTA